MKYFLVSFILLCATFPKAQSTLEVASGVNWLYLPSVSEGKVFSPQTYVIAFYSRIKESRLSLGVKGRFYVEPGKKE